MTRLLHFAAVAGAIALSACVNDPRLGETSRPLAVIQQDELPAPSGADLVAAATPYRIGPFDKLAINVFGAPDLSGTFQVDAAGGLSMPLIGNVSAVGSTPAELSADIATRLRGA